jgi:hypothetical protein
MKQQNGNNAGNAPLTGDRRDANQNKRYSFVETPVEMRASAFRPDETIPPLPALPAENTHPTSNTTAQASTQYGSVKELGRSTSPYNFPPPDGTHSAHFAPYADEMTPEPREQTHLPAHQPTPHTPMTPHSPGPVPIKSDLESQDAPNSATNAIPHTQQSQFAPPVRVFSSYQPDTVPGQSGAGIGLHSPGQIAHPNQRVVGGGWRHGLCDCGNVSTCCTGVWCPCILYGKTQYRLSQRSAKNDPTNMLGYETCNGSCITFSVLCGFQCMNAHSAYFTTSIADSSCF